MPNRKLLIVDDDAKIRALLRNVLEEEGFAVVEAESAPAALDIVLGEDLALITLDIHLGGDNGLDLAREIRKVSQVPIVMVTGRDDVIDRVAGLEIGADDYITKPFHVREVVARVRAVLRRASTSGPGIAETESVEGIRYAFDGMMADLDRLELIDRNGEDCGLTSGDFRLLRVFLERPKRVLSRDQLMDAIGGIEWSPLDRTIDNQVARLRKKIERDPAEPKVIKTVRGIGYSLACDVREVQSSGPSAKSA